MTVIGTPAAERTERAVLARFEAEVDRIGQYNRRPIANSSSWSQHSWANALDIHVSTLAEGDRIYEFLSANYHSLGIRYILWRRPRHWDHIHVDFWPKGSGVPPLTLTDLGEFTYPDGTTVRSQPTRVPPTGDFQLEEDELVALKNGNRGNAVRKLQEAVNLWRPDKQIEVDGIYGPQTEAAIKVYQTAANLPVTGMADGVTLAFLFDNASVDEPQGVFADPTARAAAAAAKARADTAHDRLDGVSLEVPG